MRRILVSLVSDQTIPNVLMIRELTEIDKTGFDLFLFVTTEKMERRHKTAAIINACGIPKCMTRKAVVDEESIVNTMNALARESFGDDDGFTVNLTGGTKMMSIGVYQFFRDRRADIYYIPINSNVMKVIQPVNVTGDRKINYRLGVAEYLKAYGIPVPSADRLERPIRDFDYAKSILKRYLGNMMDSSVIDSIRAKRNEKKGTAVDEHPGLGDFLENIRFQPRHAGRLDRGEVCYLTGGWFEEYAYWLIRDFGELDDSRILLNLRPWGPGKREIDVLFTLENALYLVECKTSLHDMKSNKSVLNDTIYKYSDLMRGFGLSVKSFIFTLDRNVRGTNGEIMPHFAEAARYSGMTIIDRPLIEDEEKRKKELEKMFTT